MLRLQIENTANMQKQMGNVKWEMQTRSKKWNAKLEIKNRRNEEFSQRIQQFTEWTKEKKVINWRFVNSNVWNRNAKRKMVKELEQNIQELRYNIKSYKSNKIGKTEKDQRENGTGIFEIITRNYPKK